MANMLPKVQYSHKTQLPSYDIDGLLRALFERAKAKDEFEFCSTLLRLRGIEGIGWDPLQESLALIDQTLGLIQAPLDQALRMRLMLFLYCHVTEMHDFYHIVGNMLRVCQGERYNLDCFAGINHPSKKNAVYPTSKAQRIKEWATQLEQPLIGEMICDMLVKEVRNAFFHSDYILHEKYFNIKRGEAVRIGNMLDQRIDLTWLTPRLELGINTVLMLIQLVVESVRSYKESKKVLGRIQAGSPVPVELIVQEGYGLVGFKSSSVPSSPK